MPDLTLEAATNPSPDHRDLIAEMLKTLGRYQRWRDHRASFDIPDPITDDQLEDLLTRGHAYLRSTRSMSTSKGLLFSQYEPPDHA